MFSSASRHTYNRFVETDSSQFKFGCILNWLAGQPAGRTAILPGMEKSSCPLMSLAGFSLLSLDQMFPNAYHHTFYNHTLERIRVESGNNYTDQKWLATFFCIANLRSLLTNYAVILDLQCSQWANFILVQLLQAPAISQELLATGLLSLAILRMSLKKYLSQW